MQEIRPRKDIGSVELTGERTEFFVGNVLDFLRISRLAHFSLSACFRMAQYVGGRSASWYHELHLPETTG